jgi:lysophospholipase L1-like esterase
MAAVIMMAGAAWGADPGLLQVPDVAAPKHDAEAKVDPRFLEMHERFLERKKQGPIGLLFIGDSITEGWANAPDVWHAHYDRYQPANFGISGDQTQHVLWRIEHGELDGLNPKVVVLMIGTNNWAYPREQMRDGVLKVVSEIHDRLPNSRLLLLGIFPRGNDPLDERVIAWRAQIAFVNEALAKLDDGDKTRYLDLGPKFLQPNGVLPLSVFPDGLHPSVEGYRLWADGMQPLLDQMMQQ